MVFTEILVKIKPEFENMEQRGKKFLLRHRIIARFRAYVKVFL